MEQMEILKQWLLSENIHFVYFYEPLLPEMLDHIDKYIILNEEMKLSRNQIILQGKNNYDISIVCQYGSLGVREGLLEYRRMGTDEGPVGYCTAEEVIEVIKEWVKDGK